MSTHDPLIPEDDEIAGAARRALQRLAGEAAPGDSSWSSVQAGARRVRQRRVATMAAACAILLVGAGAAAAVAGSRTTGRAKPVASDGASTTTTSTSTASTTTATTSPTRATVAPPPVGTGGTPPPGTTPVTIPTPAADAPQAGDFSGAIAVGGSTIPQPVDVGSEVDIATIIRNISDHPIVPASATTHTALATVCTGAAESADHPGSQSLWWMTNAPLNPGDTDGRTGTFSPQASDEGPVICQLDIVTLDPPVATFDTSRGGDAASARIIAPVSGVPAVTIEVVPTTWTVSTSGSVGPLTFGLSTQADVLANVGTPEATRQSSFGVSTFPGYDALGYDCTGNATANRLPVQVQPTVVGPYCATIFYLNVSTNTLAGFQTTSDRYATTKGTTIGTSSATAQQQEGAAVQSAACHSSGITLGDLGNQQSPGVIFLHVGPNATDVVTEIEAEDQLVQVGVLFC